MTTEYGQRILIDRDTEESGHLTTNSFPSFGSDSTEEGEDEDETDVADLLGEVDQLFGVTSNSNYGSTPDNGDYLPHYFPTTNKGLSSRHIQTIRFQVVIWNIGHLDVTTGSVPMTFRVSLFWNDLPSIGSPPGSPSKPRQQPKRKTVMAAYQMQGRHKAMPQRVDASAPSNQQQSTSTTEELDAIDVPPLSILNVSTFTIIGSPEIDMLDTEHRLMRWTCMYRATVNQDRLSVHQFPHDCHTIALELAILSHRRAGQRWDRRFWRLGLATEDDVRVSRKALQIPYGLVVDHVRIPEFHFHRHQPITHHNRQHQHRHCHDQGILPLMKSYHGDNSSKSTGNNRGLQFQFCSQQDGAFDRRSSFCAIPDVYLRVSLMVIRESGYYDRNIVPLLAFLNVVAAVITLILDPTNFFYRGLLILNIAFNQMGIRLSVDKHLPSVGYEIRMQRILNDFFFVLLALILEAATVYALDTYDSNGKFVSTYYLKWVDALAAFLALGHNGHTVRSYYVARNRARQKYRQGILDQGMIDASFSTREPQVV